MALWLSSITPVSLPASTIIRISSSVTASGISADVPVNRRSTPVMAETAAAKGLSRANSTDIMLLYLSAKSSALCRTSCLGRVSVNAEMIIHAGITIIIGTATAEMIFAAFVLLPAIRAASLSEIPIAAGESDTAA